VADGLSTFDKKSFENELYQFYGVDGNCFRLSFGGEKITLEAKEDPDDGYRSYLDCIVAYNNDNLIFYNIPFSLVEVVFVKEMGFEGFELRDFKDGHIWLKVGTNYMDDYYPYFVFEYTLKEKK
jgi:hypothetical protein